MEISTKNSNDLTSRRKGKSKNEDFSIFLCPQDERFQSKLGGHSDEFFLHESQPFRSVNQPNGNNNIRVMF